MQILVPPLTFGELCHAASLHFASFVNMSPTTASVPWWCHSLVYSRLDYSNFVLVGLPVYLQRHLQSVLNAAARLVFRLGRYDHVSDGLATLHWLRLPQRIDFKVAVMAFRVLHGTRATTPERSCSCRRPAWSSQTSLAIITSTACSVIPAHNRRSTHISRCYITTLEVTAI